jgi:hypothetical protein
MTNTANHRIVVDLHPDGQVIIWTPAGPIACLSEKDAARVLRDLAKSPEQLYSRADNTPKPRTIPTETLMDFLSRGGEVVSLTKPKSKPAAVTSAITLEDLGL